MKIAALDLPFAAGVQAGIDSRSYLQAQSLAGTDMALWDPAACFAELERRSERVAPRVLGVRAGEELLALARHWRREFGALIQRGGIVAAMLPPPSRFHVHTLQEIVRYDPLEPLSLLLPRPLRYADMAAMPGTPQAAGEPFRSLFERSLALLQPQARLQDFPGTAILHDSAGAPLACYISLPPGGMLLLPRLRPEALADPVHSSAFIHALCHCALRLGLAGGGGIAAWADDCLGPQELELLARERELRSRAQDIQTQLGTTLLAIDRLRADKRLAAGEGAGLESALAELLRRKGAFVQQDWLEQSLLVAELHSGFLVAAARGPDDTADPVFFDKLEQAQARISDYYGKSTQLLIVDGSQNRLPLHARAAAGAIQAAAEARGMLCLQGAHMYGWLLMEEPDADGLLEQARNDGAALRQRLWHSAARALTPVVASFKES